MHHKDIAAGVKNYDEWKSLLYEDIKNKRDWQYIGDWFYAKGTNDRFQGLFYHMCRMSWELYQTNQSIPPRVLDKEGCLQCGECIPEGIHMVYFLTERI